MKSLNDNFKVISISRLNNSYYGNPRYLLTLSNAAGETLTGTTALNALIGYRICNSYIGKIFNFDYHITKSNNIIFDFVR